MQRLEDENSESQAQIYKFIDQAYSWALEGMKFVAMLKMHECSSSESCQKMIEKFDDYMSDHPPMTNDDFTRVQELCTRLGDTKCLRQIGFARQKCQETSKLFSKRRELLEKIKRQLKPSHKKRERQSQETSSHRSRSRTSNTLDQNASNNSSLSHIDGTSMDSADSSSMRSRQFSSQSPMSDSSSANETLRQAQTSAKPSRKVLKKSTSAPNQRVIQAGVSHLQSHSGATFAIGSPVQVEVADDSSGKSKLTLIIEELISTEKDYVRSLNYVVENYFPEMCRLDIPQALRCKRNIIFGNIEKIAEFHSLYFLRDLKSCNDNASRVASVFQKHKDALGLYALYSKNKPQSDELLQEHGNEFFKKRQIELGDKMDLASYLLKPVQRMGKYALLLHAMSKKCSGEEKKCLQEAEELVKYQLRHGNDLLTMDSIRDCDVNLKEQGSLLRQDQFVIVSGRHRIIRRVFLFEDLILFSKPVPNHGGHDTYQYKCSYKTSEIGLTESIGESGFKFEIWFRRRRAQATQDRFILQSSSRSVKRTWVGEIRNLLWKQAVRNKDHRRIEMSSMGVGSKPHLDLAASSENRITDRSVVVLPASGANLLSERLAKSRMRSSIAVSHFGQEQQKRPYSVISSSSSSSSVGSGSLIPSLHLASWLSKFDSKHSAKSSPLISHCDIHSIAEDRNEENESSSGASSSSVLTDQADEKKMAAQYQYMTTTNRHQLTVN